MKLDINKIMDSAIDKIKDIDEIINHNNSLNDKLNKQIDEDFNKLKPYIEKLSLKIKKDNNSIIIYNSVNLQTSTLKKINIIEETNKNDSLEIEYRLVKPTSNVSIANYSLIKYEKMRISINNSYVTNYETIEELIISHDFENSISNIIVDVRLSEK